MTLKKLALSILFATPLAATALPLAGVGYFTYGNVNSYSLPISAFVYDQINGGGTGPGNPYYVASTPGAIKDQVVIYTGASGQDVTTNAAGFDDAYQTPNGVVNYASVNGAVGVVSPGNKAGIANNDANTWDASLLALKGFLAGGNPLFLFNNNDTNQDQNLAIWAKLWITTGSGGVYENRYLYLSNEGDIYGQGGTPLGNPYTYNPGNVTNPATGFGATDYVLSGGEVQGINHNLGANQVAYAADVPLLNDWLNVLFQSNDATLDTYTMHLDVKLGCVSATAWGDCDNVKIDNGYEQLFLVSQPKPPGPPDQDVPEPGTLALMGAALAGMAALRRRTVGAKRTA